MNEDLRRLGALVKARRDELNLSQMEIWKVRGGPSSTKLGQIEAGEPPAPSPKTRERLESALQWEAGSVEQILAGGDPVTIDAPASEPTSAEPNPAPGVRTMQGLYERVDGAVLEFERASAALVKAEGEVDALMRYLASTELLRDKLQPLVAEREAQLGRPLTAEERTEAAATLARPTSNEIAEWVAWSAMHDQREWTRWEMALIEHVFDYPQDGRRGSAHADIEPFRERVRRLRVPKIEIGGGEHDRSAANQTPESGPANQPDTSPVRLAPAARRVKGKSAGRRAREEQDQSGEAPDPEGPEGGA